MFLPASGAATDLDSNTLVGIYLRPGNGSAGRVSFELAVNVGAAEQSGGYESMPVTGDLNLLLALGGNGRSPKGYLVAGAGGHVELVEETGSGNEYTNYGGTVNLGASLLFGGGRFDLRAAHNLYLGSKNVSGRTVVALGYGF
jgi:hypothetical protein